ncbi:hypothetical protein BDV12DRAFT_179549 [Aspergillus spectabilis]
MRPVSLKKHYEETLKCLGPKSVSALSFTMTTFNAILSQSTARGSNIVPGCVFAAVDKTGKLIYSGSSGYDSVSQMHHPSIRTAHFGLAVALRLLGPSPPSNV